MITREDIRDVAKSINVELTNAEVNYIFDRYDNDQKQDPTATWDLVVEDTIHQCVEMRKDKKRYDLEIFGEDASTDYRRFSCGDDIIDMGTQIV